ncbi:MAG: foldase [Streptococcaceae bacterium]|nr:foldase [Streptococcaceae bacterium]
MKLSKKLAILAATVFAAIGLAGCVKTSPNTAIITMKGHQITVTDFYNEAKTFPSLPASNLLQNATFSYIFEKEFGKQVSSADVENKFNSMAAQYGGSSTFSSQLQQQGYTTTSYKAQLRLQLLQQKAIDKQIQATQFTEANLKTAWETYHPEVDTYIASSTNQSDAQKAHDLATNSSDEFISQAKDNNLEQKFDSSNTTIPSQVMTAAFALKNGQASDIISVQGSNGATTYYVVYMINNPGKGTDMSKYTKQLKAYIQSQKENDSTYVASVMKTYLTKYNVIVKEQTFSGIFQNYTGLTN